MNIWKVDMNRLVEIVAERMYSDPLKAGIRELITNSLDARIGQVEININYDDILKKLSYSDNGIGIDPVAFKEIYGKIASGHKRKKGSRGFFGIGRMSLIAASEKGMIMSYKNKKVYTWTFDRNGWEGPLVEEDLDEIGHGVYLQFEGIKIEDLRDIEEWIVKAFTIPILKEECLIFFNQIELFTEITGPDRTLWEDSTETPDGKITYYTKEESDGTLFICQKGILVREESFTGLSAYIDQSFLDIKTDREGFVNNEKYRNFRKAMKKELAELRPAKSFEKMEVDFIQKVMKEFKRYWFTKARSVLPVKETIEIEFPETGEEIVKEEEPIVEDKGVQQDEAPHIDDPGYEDLKKEIEEWDNIPNQPIEIPQEWSDEQLAKDLKEANKDAYIEDTRIIPEKEEKVVKIKGAKPVDLGEDYPMVFFEREPFVLVFNTSHPVFKQLVEKGKLGSAELAVLFERMFECAYIDQYPTESLEEMKKRWKEVDQKLKKIFK